MRNTVIILSVFFLTGCSETKKEITITDTPVADQTNHSDDTISQVIQNEDSVSELKIPIDCKEIRRTTGDLNKDGKDELIVVFENETETEWGPERELCIYQLTNNEWELWHKSKGAIMLKEEGGMMGDPFMAISVEKGCIVTEHFGGSRSKWEYTHRFRYQNDNWELIGVTAQYGTVCEEWQKYDYNLSTGKVKVLITDEACPEVEDAAETVDQTIDEYSFDHKMDALPSLGDFKIAVNSVYLPEDKGGAFYF